MRKQKGFLEQKWSILINHHFVIVVSLLCSEHMSCHVLDAERCWRLPMTSISNIFRSTSTLETSSSHLQGDHLTILDRNFPHRARWPWRIWRGWRVQWPSHSTKPWRRCPTSIRCSRPWIIVIGSSCVPRCLGSLVLSTSNLDSSCLTLSCPILSYLILSCLI